MNTPSQRKKLPVHPSIEHLQKQAKRRVKQNQSPSLAAAQHEIAREYGCKNWAELARVVEAMRSGGDQLAYVQRKVEALPQAARDRDFAKVREILAGGDFTFHDLDAALAHALWYGDDSNWDQRKEIADLLLEHGADPDGQYGSNYGPIVLGTGECFQPLGLQYLIDAGADVTFEPVDTKYGPACPMMSVLGTYDRGKNDRKHQMIDILLRHGAWVPPDVTPPIMAIHQGDAGGLSTLLDADSGLVSRRFRDMPAGNILLHGATLLHCAVEFGEIECLEVLLGRHADINMKADVIDGIGGQTPIFHAINSCCDRNLYMLEHLKNRVGQWIDMSVSATWRGNDGWSVPGKPQAKPMTPLEYAESAATEDARKWRKRIDEELRILRVLDHSEQLKSAILREDARDVVRLLDDWPDLLTPGLWPIAIFQAKSLSMTRLLLDRGLNPDECSAPRKPLHLAVYQCLPDIVELLIARGADVNLRNPLNETPLELLDAYEPRPVGDPDARRIRRALLQAGAVEDIYTVIRAGDTLRLREMLEADPGLAKSDSELGGPLFAASRSGRPGAVSLLLEFGADPNKTNSKDNTPLWFAAQSPARPASDRIAVMKLLLDAGADINRRCEDGSTALQFAAWRGPAEVVDFLLSRGARNWIADNSGKLPLDHAKRSTVSPDKEAIIRLFTEPRIEDPVFREAVDAVTAGDVQTLKRLLSEHPRLVSARAEERGQFAGPYFYEPTLLHFVAGNPTRAGMLPENICEVTQAILDAGAGVDAVTLGPSPGSTTLNLVATSEPARKQGLQLPLIELLVRNGANPRHGFSGAVNHRERAAVDLLVRLAGGRHTLLTAASAGEADIVRKLLKTPADRSELAEAANVATIEGHLHCLELILNAGLPVDTRMPNHPYAPTLLHQAAWFGRTDVVERLLELGADPALCDTQYNGTPADWAHHGGHPELEALIRKAGSAT